MKAIRPHTNLCQSYALTDIQFKKNAELAQVQTGRFFIFRNRKSHRKLAKWKEGSDTETQVSDIRYVKKLSNIHV